VDVLPAKRTFYLLFTGQVESHDALTAEGVATGGGHLVYFGLAEADRTDVRIEHVLPVMSLILILLDPHLILELILHETTEVVTIVECERGDGDERDAEHNDDFSAHGFHQELII
jgi:hypothetical protein